jgi:hypothetical protein
MLTTLLNLYKFVSRWFLATYQQNIGALRPILQLLEGPREQAFLLLMAVFFFLYLYN